MKKENRIEKILNSGKDGDGMAEISIEIDSLTNCLVLNRTGEEFDTEYKELRKTIGKLEAKNLQKEGWLFDWAMPYQAPGMQVYGLYIAGDDELQGLIALRHERANFFTHIELMESAPQNRVQKKYAGVGGHLFAIACKLSFDAGNDGYVEFTAKTDLINYYRNSFGAKSISGDGRKMIIETPEAIRLVEKYFKEGGK